MKSESPVCYIVAGPNGTGKTTCALHYLSARMVKTELFLPNQLSAKNMRKKRQRSPVMLEKIPEPQRQ